MAMLTNETRPMPWDDLYALATPKRAVQHALQHGQRAAAAHRGARAGRQPDGLPRRRTPRSSMFEQPDDVVEQAFLDDLYAIYPEPAASWPRRSC